MKRKHTNHGIIADQRSQKEKAKDYIAGSTYIVPKEILKPDGDWEKYLPKKETQFINNEFESLACVSFSFNNVLETLIRFQFGIEANFSDRFLAKMSKTDERNGNWFWDVFQTARQFGLVDEDKWGTKDLPRPINKASYYASIPENIKTEALDFKNNWEIFWETIPNLNKEQFISSMKFWLKYSPLWVCINNWTHAVSVYADASNKAKIYDHYFEEKYLYDWERINLASILVLVKKDDLFVKTKNSPTIYLKIKNQTGTVLAPIKNPDTYWALSNRKKEQGWAFTTINEDKLKEYKIIKPISIY